MILQQYLLTLPNVATTTSRVPQNPYLWLLDRPLTSKNVGTANYNK
jgi:hypothetical protein